MRRGEAAGEDLGEVDSYYERILPFYELETLARDDLDFWRSLVGRFRPASVLEIGAGLGRVTAELAPLTRLAVGVEPSVAMLRRARGRGSRSARLVGGDMRRLPFCRRFDLIVAPGDPFCHVTSLDERRAALREIVRCLAPGGHFVLETLRMPRGNARRRRRRLRVGGTLLLIEETWRRVDSSIWRATFHYRLRDGDQDRGRQAAFLARPWAPGAVSRLFAEAGLVVEETWANFPGASNRSESPRRIVLARRRSLTTARASGAAVSRRPRAAVPAARSRAARRAGTGTASRAY